MKKLLMLIVSMFSSRKTEPTTKPTTENNKIRVHKYNDNTYLVQRYERDPMLGYDCWGTVYADDRILDKMGLHRRIHAIFDDAKSAETYMEEHKKLCMA
jgi:hypothetical protein